jgi:hypothetical protein
MLPWTEQDRRDLETTERGIAAALGSLPKRRDLLALDDIRDRLRADLSDVGEMLAGEAPECRAGDCACGDPSRGRRQITDVLGVLRMADHPKATTPDERVRLEDDLREMSDRWDL